MEILDLNRRKEYLKEIGSSAALKMSEALQNITGEEIKVEFGDIQTYEHNKLTIDLREKCFGSYVNFKSCHPVRRLPRGIMNIQRGELSNGASNNVEGIVAATFPLSSTKIFIDLLTKRYLNKLDKQKIDAEMKLSVFKETLNILLSTYISEVANTFKTELKIGAAKFVCFRNVEFMQPALLKKYSKSDSFVSAGQFRIIGERRSDLRPILKGALISFFDLNYDENTLKRRDGR